MTPCTPNSRMDRDTCPSQSKSRLSIAVPTEAEALVLQSVRMASAQLRVTAEVGTKEGI